MKKWLMLVSLWFVVYGFANVNGMYVWRKGTSPSKEDSIPIKYIKNENKSIISNVASNYSILVAQLTNYTIDQKCERGLPLGVGFQWYNPYVDMGSVSGSGFTISGIFPHVTKNLMEQCCPRSEITYGRHFVSIQEIEENAQDEGDIDIYFPLYSLDGKKSHDYKDFPFIPIVTAPRIVVLVPDRLFAEINPRMQVLISTIFNAWPMLIFIIVSTMLAGLIVWFLDRKRNSKEFPPTFYHGAWEGIWWAFVTMTTVGYGDRSPRSPYARAFCIVWILVGIILISLFTGLVTSALSASSTPVFNIAGSKIGAIRGSIEYQVGVGYNADMKAYDNHADMLDDLLKTRNMHAVLIDNFILSANAAHFSKQVKVRMEREIEEPITYGITLGDRKSRYPSKVYECFKRYVSHHSHDIFEIISKKLVPIKNPGDEVRLEVAAAESLFYEDSLFKTIVYSEVGVLIVMFLFGFLSERWSVKESSGAISLYHKLRNGKTAKDYNLNHVKSEALSLSEKSDSTETCIFSTVELQTLISEYDDYHLKWIHKVRSASKQPPPIIHRTTVSREDIDL